MLFPTEKVNLIIVQFQIRVEILVKVKSQVCILLKILWPSLWYMDSSKHLNGHSYTDNLGSDGRQMKYSVVMVNLMTDILGWI